MALIASESASSRSVLAIDRAALAESPRHLFLGQAVLFDEICEAGRLFERIEVLPLQVLDDGEFERLAVVAGADDRGNRRLSPMPRRRASAVRPRPVRTCRLGGAR